MLNSLASILGIADPSDWVERTMAWGEQVELYRDYVAGRHPIRKNDRQKKALNLGQYFGVDYTDTIVRAMAERLVVESIITMDGDEQADIWVQEILDRSDFDILQMQLHNAATRDGDAYIMIGSVSGDGETELRLSIDFAWNGKTGIVPIRYDEFDNLSEVVKVFEVDDQVFVWHYTREMITQYEVIDSSIVPIDGGESAWNAPLPIIAFSNRREPNQEVGISEIAKVIDSQDMLNSTVLDMIMTSNLSGFPIYFAKGFDFPGDEVAPGMIVNPPRDLSEVQLNAANMVALPSANLAGYIDQSDRIIEFMADISATPLRNKFGANESGEAMRQREAGLLAKIKAGQVYFGDSWVQVLNACVGIADAYGGGVRTDGRFTVEWQEPEVRSDQSIIEQAAAVFEVTGSLELYLKMISKVLDWDDEEIERFLERSALTAGERSDNIGEDGEED